VLAVDSLCVEPIIEMVVSVESLIISVLKGF
jgi:hypothetical protein